MTTNRLRPLIKSLLAAGTALALVTGCGDGSRGDRPGKTVGVKMPAPTMPAAPVVPLPVPVPPGTPVAAPVKPLEARTFDAYMKAGKTLAQKGDVEAAIEQFEKAREEKPASALPHIELARVKLDAKLFAEAREHAQLAIELAPSSSLAWNTMGRVELAEGDLPAATVSFERAVDENPDNSFAWNNLGYVLMKQLKWQEAAEALERATGGEKPEPYMWNNLGMAYEMLDRVVEARNAYRKGSEAGSQLAGLNFARLEGVTSMDDTAVANESAPPAAPPAAPELEDVVDAGPPAAAPPAEGSAVE